MALTEGTPTTLISGADASQAVDIVKLTTNKALVTYAKSTVTYGRVIDISGGSISAGSQQDIWSGGDVAPAVIWVVSSSLAVIFGEDENGDAAMRTLSISGTTITENTVETVEALSGTVENPRIGMASSTVGLVAYNNGTATQLCRFTISGTTITAGTPEDLDGAATQHDPLGMCQLDSSRVAFFYNDANANEAMVQIIDISSSISKGTAAQLDTNATNGGASSIHNIVKVDTDKLVAFFTDDSESPAEISAIVVTTSGTSISGQGTRLNLLANDDYQALSIDVIDSSTVIVIYNQVSGSIGPFALTLGISGTTLTDNNDDVTTATDPTANGYCSIAVVDTDEAILIVQGTPGDDIDVSIIGGFSGAGGAGPYDLTHSTGGAANGIVTSSDGAYVFLALEDTDGNQVIAYAARSDLSAWTAAYNPGAGSACNVAQVFSNPDKMIFYGNFGTDVTVIEYTISTDSTSDISPSSLGAKVVNTLRVNPSDANEMVATVDTDEDVIYTSDGGSTWSTWDASLGFDATGLWVLWSGAYYPHRYFAGGDNGSDLDVKYSPNEGSSDANYEDATLGGKTAITNIEAVEG